MNFETHNAAAAAAALHGRRPGGRLPRVLPGGRVLEQQGPGLADLGTCGFFKAALIAHVSFLFCDWPVEADLLKLTVEPQAPQMHFLGYINSNT